MPDYLNLSSLQSLVGWRGALIRALGIQLSELGFESCAAALHLGQVPFALHCCSSLSCMNEYLAVNSGGYVNTNNLCTCIAAWLSASQSGQTAVQLTKSESVK